MMKTGFFSRERQPHPSRRARGARHGRWKGGKPILSHGYAFVSAPGHPRADSRGYVREHIIVAERALGRRLERRHRVHHVNEVRSDNRSRNLVICEDHRYHSLLHQRMRALAGCGDANARKCYLCQTWDSVANGRIDRDSFYHVSCKSAYNRVCWAKRRAS